MLETKEQKQIFAGSITLIVILAAVSFWHRPDLNYQSPPVSNKTDQEVLNSQAYLDYLRAANVDQKASQDLFQTIMTKDDITQAVNNQLQVNQKIVPPAVDSSKIKTVADSSQKAVNDYLTASVSQVYNFNTNSASLADSLFSGDASAQDQIGTRLKTLTNELYSQQVPKDAVALHKALITAYLAYSNLLDAGKAFDANDLNNNDAFWPKLYSDYVVANDSGKTYAEELNKLASKYKISSITVNYLADNGQGKKTGNIFIPEAQAFLGIGDTTFNFTLGDIPRIIMDGVKEGIRSAFLKFMGTMLGKLITKIEQNYMIANFLYYSDALVNGQYVNDYLNKYLSDPLDRSIVKSFIPQFNCGKNPDLKRVFQAQANQYLGFDPQTLSPNDPNYYQKMARVGDFMSSPQGWQFTYENFAAQAQSQAQQAVDRELTSSGLKTPRNTVESSISASISNIVSSERASFNALLQMGISNADSVISGVVAQLTQNLLNQFVFQGATSNQGNIAVYKEQPTCVSTAVLNPVLPLPPTELGGSGTPPTVGAAVAQSCSVLSSLADDCSSAMLGELEICANHPSDHTGTMSCSSLAGSPYTQAMLDQCGRQARQTTDCSNLQTYISKIH